MKYTLTARPVNCAKCGKQITIVYQTWGSDVILADGDYLCDSCENLKSLTNVRKSLTNDLENG